MAYQPYRATVVVVPRWKSGGFGRRVEVLPDLERMGFVFNNDHGSDLIIDPPAKVEIWVHPIQPGVRTDVRLGADGNDRLLFWIDHTRYRTVVPT